MLPLILIAPPWALFNRPSIQLASLKAYLRQRFPELAVKAEHLHLETAAQLGYPLYQEVSERSWVAEAVAASLLFPENRPAIERLFRQEGRGGKEIARHGLERLAAEFDAVYNRFLDRIDWQVYGLAGITVSLCQTTSGLLLLRRIKERRPQLPVVLGGSSFSGEEGKNLARLFPGVDHLVRGEGEGPLAELAAHYCTDSPSRPLLATRQPPPLNDLDQLPSPDFSEYFAFLHSLPQQRRFFPTLPIEMSRGCLWQARRLRPDDDGQQRNGACAFCNLNLQWQGYRHKSATKVATEIEDLARRHRVLSFAFMDNLLPPREGADLMRRLGEGNRELRLFAEIRADTSAARLHEMHRAGVRSLQVGIEALSGGLLKKLGKGTNVMANVEMMRHCEALALPHGGNLLLGFPGSDEDDVRETLATMERVSMLRPLAPVHFWLGLHSPVHANPAAYGIVPSGNHRHWRTLLGERLGSQLRLLVQGYRGQLGRQRRLWAPVVARTRAWQRSYHALALPGRNSPPILGYHDGGDFLLLNERREGGTTLRHRLVASSRDIYLFCRTSRSRRQLQQAFADIDAAHLNTFLLMMADKGLMFSAEGRYLSLAVPMEPGIERLDGHGLTLGR